MTVWPSWRDDGRRIKAAPANIEWGLHVTLTDAPALGEMPQMAPHGRLPSLPHLAAKALSRGLPRSELRDEIARQLDAFEAVVGAPPAFVDGHQHVHVLPGVRQEILALFEGRLDPARTWLRVCTAPLLAIMRRGVARRRALIIDRLSRPLQRAVRKLGLTANDEFRGVTDFEPDTVAREFNAWLASPSGRTLIMCHPGCIDDVLARRDPVLERRAAELAYLGGPQFSDALAGHGLTVAPFAR